MSTSEFNKLFQGYPENARTRRLKGEIHAAIARSLIEIDAERTCIEKMAFSDRHKLDAVINRIAALDILIVPGVPNSVTEAVEHIFQRGSEALRAYNDMAQAPYGSAKRRSLTSSHFRELKKAYIRVLDDLAVWLRSAKPDID